MALCLAASPALAQFEIKLSVGDGPADSTATPAVLGGDISHADGNQVQYTQIIGINIMSTKVVNFHATATAATAALSTDPVKSGAALGADDFTVIAYNKFGGTVATPPALTVVTGAATPDGMHFMLTVPAVTAPNLTTPAPATEITRVLIVLDKDSVELADPRAEMEDGKRKAAGKNKEASIELHYVAVTEGDADGTGTDATLDVGEPTVISIARADSGLRPVTAATFEVLITLSEEPKKDGFKKDHIDVANATAGDPTFLDKIMEPSGDPSPTNLKSSGRDMMLYRYIVTLTPKYENKNDIVVKVKMFYDQEKGMMHMYMPPATPADYTEGMDKLTVKVGKEAPPDKTAGFEVILDKEKRIPASGYLVVATKIADSGVADNPENDKDEPKASARTPAQLLYNVIEKGLPNLEAFLANGGTIDLVAPAGVYISEVMWGSDASLQPSNNSQWIEIANTGTSSVLTGDKTHKLKFYGPNETLPALSTVADRIGTVGVGGHWELINKGQPGRTGTGEKAADVVAVVPTQALISMQRVMNAAGSPADGTLKDSWVQSEPPGLNFSKSAVGTRIGTPGAAPVSYPVAPPPKQEETPPPETPVAEAEDIMITEIMVDTGNSRLPQWIELTNVSGAKVSLAGWSVQITNSGADADAVGSSVTIDLMGTLGVGGGMDKGGTLGKSLLLVAWSGRSSSNLDGSERVVNVSSEVGQRGRYKLISDTAFMIALIPPQKTGVLTYGDTAGNLGATEAWELPMSDNGRSSLIRREMLKDGTATMGTDANGWILASETPLVTGHATWYGSDEDAGTPGSDAGGPLPVELSHFRPARDKATGAVVITWSTQSELNNAGFFIKRSQQRNGEFKVINAAMVPGAGTTSEKQSYTYTDTTAQPNVVYYYQIEDVSLDGNRQTLTRGIRLKGHVGAAGKATTTWGDLKTQE